MPELNTLQSYLKMFSFPFWWYLSKLYIKLSRVSNASQLPHVRLNVTYWAAASCLCGGGECTLLSSVYLQALCGGSKPRSSRAPKALCAPAGRCLLFAVLLRHWCVNCWQRAPLRRQLTVLLREMWLSWRPPLYFLFTKSSSGTDSWCIGSQKTTSDAKQLGERGTASYKGNASSRDQDIPCSDFYERGLQVKDTWMVWLKICGWYGKMLFSIKPMLFLCLVQMLCCRSFLFLSK